MLCGVICRVSQYRHIDMNSPSSPTVRRNEPARRWPARTRGLPEVRDKFFAGQMRWAQPWLLMMLELWHRQVVALTPAHFPDPVKARQV